MKIGLLVKGLLNPAVLLSVSRAVAACALLYLVPHHMWLWAAFVLGWALYSDIIDGGIAEECPHPWNGKLMNDIPSGILSWLAPASLLLWLYQDHPDADSVGHSAWFWRWVAAFVVFLVGTLVFNAMKSAKRLNGKTGAARQQTLDSMVRVEVAQGWFYGVYMVAILAQLWHMEVVERFGDNPNVDYGINWVIFAFLVLMAITQAKHRLCDRPEVRAKYAV